MSDTTREVPCAVCDGTGKVPDHDTGKLEGNAWIVRTQVPCWSCGGKGMIREDKAE